MKIRNFALYRILGGLFAVLQIFTFANAQDVEVRFTVDDGRRTVRVEGRFSPASKVAGNRNLGFLTSVIGDNALGKRLTKLELKNGAEPVPVRKLMDGEYLADSGFNAWTYDVDISPGPNPTALAHRSWIDDTGGILMTDDLLPQFGDSVPVKVRVDLPAGWKSFAQASYRRDDGSFLIPDHRDGLIYIGKGHRTISAPDSPDVLITGKWSFSDAEAAGIAAEIYGAYAELFGSAAAETLLIAIVKFPQDVPAGSWEAEARGAGVTIVSSDMAFPSQSIQRLHEQLRHELFHLWVPNSMVLTGQYAWFYEGFALYQSLKTAVAMNRIRFDDMLDTLSRAYAIDARQNPRKPLAGPGAPSHAGDTQTYARGMLIAFLADLRLMQSSKGKRSVSDILRELYRSHSAGSEPADANTAIARALNDEQLIKDHVYGTSRIEWGKDLAAAGLTFSGPERSPKLAAVTDPSGRQKEILDQLGYNNWRKTTRRPKR